MEFSIKTLYFKELLLYDFFKRINDPCLLLCLQIGYEITSKNAAIEITLK